MEIPTLYTNYAIHTYNYFPNVISPWITAQSISSGCLELPGYIGVAWFAIDTCMYIQKSFKSPFLSTYWDKELCLCH